MKIKSFIILITIILIFIISCNIQYLSPDNALEEANKINFFVYQIIYHILAEEELFNAL